MPGQCMDEARAAGAGGQGVGGAEKRRRENVGDARLRRTADLGHVHAPQLLALSAPLLASFRPSKSFLHAEPSTPASAFTAASASSSRARSGSIGQGPASSAPAESSAVAAARLKSVCSIAFDDRGDYVLSAGDDETVQVFSCRAGK